MDEHWFPMRAAEGPLPSGAALPARAGDRVDPAGSSGTAPIDLKRLREVAGEFEGEFVRLFLSAMRRTVPKTEVFGKRGSAEGIWEELMDRELAESAGRRSTLGLADLVVRALSPRAGRQGAGGATASGSGFLDLARQSDPTSLVPVTSGLGHPISLAGTERASRAARLPAVQATSRMRPAEGPPARAPGVKSEGAAGAGSDSPGARQLEATGPLDLRLLDRLRAHDGPVMRAARELGLEPNLVRAVMTAESSARRLARSSRGALGLMQLMPETARELGVKNPWDPDENLRAGARYLKSMLERFGGDLQLALAGYNAGPATVERYGQVPPYTETRSFVRRVLELRELLGRVFPDG
jgi:soluble lytic murein transglycosylase-like protein